MKKEEVNLAKYEKKEVNLAKYTNIPIMYWMEL